MAVSNEALNRLWAQYRRQAEEASMRRRAFGRRYADIYGTGKGPLIILEQGEDGVYRAATD